MIPYLAFKSSPWLYPVLGLYVLLFMTIVIGIGIWNRRKRRERVPVEFKLLRGPGETLRRNIAEMDENLVLVVLAGAFGPILATYPALWLLIRWQPESPTEFRLGLGGVLLVFFLSAIMGGRWIWKKLSESRNYLLGYLGERAVAEELTPLGREGYRIYHDVPAGSGNRKFNLDHVVVGPTGVSAIETKTRRKGRARPGFKDHEVTFDGQKLIWQWGEIAQLHREAARRPVLESGPDGHDDRVTLIKLPERELVVDIQRDQQLVPGPTSACAHGENLPRRRPQAKPAFREINPTSPPGPDPRKRPALPPRPIPVWSDLFCVFCAFLRPILQSPASGSPSLRPPVLRPSATLSAAANSTVKLALRRDERHTIDGEIPMVRR